MGLDIQDMSCIHTTCKLQVELESYYMNFVMTPFFVQNCVLENYMMVFMSPQAETEQGSH